MRYSAQIIIQRPRDRVVELIRDPANIPKWQPGVVSVQLIAGAKDEVGSKSRVVYEVGGVRLSLTETVITHNPPDLFVSSYEARGVKNISENRFSEEGPDATRWVLSNDFKFTGVMSVMGVFLNDVLPRQVKESMIRFKEFAESQ